MRCPRCGGPCDRDEADVGIGVIGGPWGCPACHWIEGEGALDDYVVPSPARKRDEVEKGGE